MTNQARQTDAGQLYVRVSGELKLEAQCACGRWTYAHIGIKRVEWLCPCGRRCILRLSIDAYWEGQADGRGN